MSEGQQTPKKFQVTLHSIFVFTAIMAAEFAVLRMLYTGPLVFDKYPEIWPFFVGLFFGLPAFAVGTLVGKMRVGLAIGAAIGAVIGYSVWSTPFFAR